MKKLLVCLVALLGLNLSVRAANWIERPASLLLPDEISMQDRIRATVEFRWMDEAPVVLATWLREGRLSTEGEIRFFEESGKEVPMSFPMSMPPVPNGQKEIRKGETFKIELYQTGSVHFPRPGKYYAVATFSWASSGGVTVRFTTGKRWVRVIEDALKTKDV